MEENQEFGFGHLGLKPEMYVMPLKLRGWLTVGYVSLEEFRGNCPHYVCKFGTCQVIYDMKFHGIIHAFKERCCYKSSRISKYFVTNVF